MKRLVNPEAVGRTEADIQSDIKMLLLGGAFELDSPRLEEQLDDGSRRRIDIGVGATVLEVKRTLVDGAADDEIAQLAGYVQTRVQQTGGRYNGILTNGRLWWLFEFDPATENFQRRSTFELSHTDRAADLISWLQAVLATHSDVVPSQRSIEELLGSSSPAYAQDIAYLQGLYRQVADDPTVQLKRDLWARLLRSALGTGFEDHEQLFLDHTLLVIEAAIIAHRITSPWKWRHLKSVIVPSVQSPPSMLKLHDFCNRALNVLFRQSEQFLVRKLWEQGWTIDQDTDRATKTFWSAVFGAVLISQAGFPGGPSSVDVAATLSIRSTEER